jgi:hypothetical protein
MSPGGQNMKMRPDALGTAENMSGRTKQETGPDAFGTVENESGSAKHEKVTKRPRYSRK